MVTFAFVIGNVKPGEHNKYVNENFITDDTPITIEQVLSYIQRLCSKSEEELKSGGQKKSETKNSGNTEPVKATKQASKTQ